MNRLLRGLSYKDTHTENGMPTHSASGSACVDFFGAVGAARGWESTDIKNLFIKALDENPLVAMRTLFWARDIRGGAGERRVFRVCLEVLQANYLEYLSKNIQLVPEYGRWDDLFHLAILGSEEVLQLITVGLEAKDGLLAKWLPRKGPFANTVRKYIGVTPKVYRKLIVGLSKTVEQQMCAKQWENITYEHVPSQAMNKYRKAFGRNDGSRFTEFIEKVTKGETKIHSGTLFPYQLYQAYCRHEKQSVVEAQWKSLPNFMEDNKNMVLPMCDVSGSMTNGYNVRSSLTPMDVSVSLGIYISERNEGPFKDAFMTFSGKPQLQYLKGTFYNRCSQLRRAHWSMNTDLESAFNTILTTALREKVSPDEMPDTLLIISDMQFDRCVHNPQASVSDMMKGQYATAGYQVPQVVFWNVNARPEQSPVRFNEWGTGLVSGCSPSILKSVLDGSILSPESVMLKTVMSERYDKITI